jgi:hypothetical protein
MKLSKGYQEIIDYARELLNTHNSIGQPKLDKYIDGWGSIDQLLDNLRDAFKHAANDDAEEEYETK